MIDFVGTCTPLLSRIKLRVAMDFLIAQTGLFWGNIFCRIQGIPGNNLAPTKNCPGVGCKVGQIRTRGIAQNSKVP